MLTSLLIIICIMLIELSSNNKNSKLINRPKRGLIIARVSTAEQTKGTSLEIQKEWGVIISRETSVKIVKIIQKDISGELFSKEYYNEIMKIVKKEKITHIFVYSFDRLSRSFVYGVRLVNDLWENNVQIITSTFSPDKNKHSHRIRVWLSLLFAEMEHGGIAERTSRGMIHKLKQGIYTRKKPPWGFELIDLKLRLKSGFKEIINDIFNIFIKVKSYTVTARIINKKYKKKLEAPLIPNKVNQIINDRKYTGFYSYNDLLIGDENNKPRQEMIAVDKETFEEAQKIAQSIRNRCNKKICILSPKIDEWIDEYGQGFVKNYLNCLTWKCPKCGSTDVIENGSQVRSGSLHKLLECKNEGYHFRAPTAKQITLMHSLQPHRCMNCGTVDNFDVTNSQLSDYFKVICRECKFEAHIRKKDNIFPKNNMVNRNN